jgi:hypothetical protein
MLFYYSCTHENRMRMHSFTAPCPGFGWKLYLFSALSENSVVIELQASTENGC